MDGILLVVSGPAGSGKNTVCERLMSSCKNITRAITTTTRAPRQGEADGKDYHFVSVEEFESAVKRGDFYEWAMVHGRYYGTSKSEILSKLESGKDVILIIDVQGAKAWREIAKKDAAVAKSLRSVFIRPQSLDVVRERMVLRGDDKEDIERRIKTAERELLEEKNFDFAFVSKTKDEDFISLKNIYEQIKKA